MSSGVRWLFMSCFLFGGGAGLWDGGRSILQGKKRLLSRKQEKSFCCFDLPKDLIVFVTKLPIQSHRLSPGAPPVPFVSPQFELLMEINSLQASCPYCRQIPVSDADPELGHLQTIPPEELCDVPKVITG